MQVFVTNVTSQPKMIPLPSGKNLLPRRSIEMAVSEEELVLLQRTQGFSVQLRSTVDPTNQLSRGTLFGEKPSYTPKVSVGHLKNKVEELEAKLHSGEGHDLFKGVVLETRLSIIESKLNYLLDSMEEIRGQLASGSFVTQTGPTASELLNMEPNPQESRRALFERVVKDNKEIRDDTS